MFVRPTPGICIALALLAASVLVVGCGSDPLRTRKTSKVEIPGLAPPSYGEPIVNPIDSTIGFNHSVLLKLVQEPGYRYAVRTDSGGGFFMMPWSDTTMTHVGYFMEDATWEPDGKRILFWDSGRILSVAASAEGLNWNDAQEFTLPGDFFGPKWNSTRTKMAVYGTTYPYYGVHLWDTEAQAFSRVGGDDWKYPDWGPGDRLACVGSVSEGAGLIVLDSLTAVPRLIAKGFDIIWTPTWSPDGHEIAFCARSGATTHQLYVVKADGTDLRQITTEGANFGVAWSPSGATIVYVRHSYTDWNCVDGNYVNGTLWRVNLDTGVKQQLTFNRGVIVEIRQAASISPPQGQPAGPLAAIRR